MFLVLMKMEVNKMSSTLNYPKNIEGELFYFEDKSEATRAYNLSISKERENWSCVLSLLYAHNFAFDN